MPTAAPGMQSSPCSVVWSPWVSWWPRRSRVDLFCHETRAVGHLTQVSYASLGRHRYARWGGRRVMRAPDVAYNCSKLLILTSSDDAQVIRVIL